MGLVPVPDPPVKESKSGCLPWILLALLALLLLLLLLWWLLSGDGGTQTPVVIPETTGAATTTVSPSTEATPEATEPSVEVTQPQTEPVDYDSDTRPGYLKGSCRDLRGDVAVVVLFVDDPQSSWTGTEMHNYLTSYVQPSIDFVEQEAERYGVEVDLQLHPFYTFEGIGRQVCSHNVVDDLMVRKGGTLYPDGASADSELLSVIAVNWGFADLDAMHQWMLAQTDCDQVAYMIACDKNGWSHAYMDRDFEVAYVFNREQGGTDQSTGTFAHEMLHLFGADDLYMGNNADGTQTRVERARIMERVCPNAIMYNNHLDWSKNPNVICTYTAYCIGWLDTMPEEFDVPGFFQ